MTVFVGFKHQVLVASLNDTFQCRSAELKMTDFAKLLNATSLLRGKKLLIFQISSRIKKKQCIVTKSTGKS